MYKDDNTSLQREKSEDFKLIPIFASSVMTITNSGGFHQFLVFDYYEKSGNYFRRINEDDYFLNNEVENIRNNMQGFMDACANMVNGHMVYPKVIEVDIDFRNKNLPFFSWIIEFNGKLREGINIYESEIEEEELEYNINSVYIFEKPLDPIDVETALHYDIIKENRIIKFYGNRGEKVGPLEILRFNYKKEGS